jgi:hypothetical protein
LVALPIDLQKITQGIFSIDDRIRYFAILDKEKVGIQFEKYADKVKPFTPDPQARRTLLERLETSLRERWKKDRYGEIKYILKSYENVDYLIFLAGRYVFIISSKPQVLSEIISRLTPKLNDLREMLDVENW